VEDYTLEALLYQDILKYSVSFNRDYPENKNDSRFTTWELTGWLIENNSYYYNYYNDPSTKKIPRRTRKASRLEHINKLVDEFTALGLVQRLGNAKARRGDTTTDVYIFTRFGYILAWIIESFDTTKGNIPDQKIYDILDYHFRDNPSSKDIFYSTLHKKFKENGVYGEFVVDRLRTQINTTALTWNMTHLLSLIFMDTESIKNTDLYGNIWLETFNEMDDNIMALLFQELKLEIERRMFEYVRDVKRYERLRYHLREKYDILAMEVKCVICKTSRYIEISIQDYLEMSDSTVQDKASGICPKCQSHNSTIIPML
jgi:hypothetical protein